MLHHNWSGLQARVDAARRGACGDGSPAAGGRSCQREL